MDKELKQLLVVEGMMEAEIIKTKLENFEIPCMLKFETAGRLMGISMNGLGKVQVMVSSKDYDYALEIMEEASDEPSDETGAPEPD
ncbi:MAG: DUF2007 domain-containing protein [bacterium]|nr:DUF2007 domain-containing protein [bacterium]